MRRIERGEEDPIGRRQWQHLWRLRRRQRWLRYFELERFGGAFGRGEDGGKRVVGFGDVDWIRVCDLDVKLKEVGRFN